MDKQVLLVNKPTLLINEQVDNEEELISRIINNRYSSLDTEIPICRFRGTLIKRLADKIKIVGWQRNVSRQAVTKLKDQKKDSSIGYSKRYI